MFASRIVTLPRASTWFERVARAIRELSEEIEAEVRAQQEQREQGIEDEWPRRRGAR